MLTSDASFAFGVFGVGMRGRVGSQRHGLLQEGHGAGFAALSWVCERRRWRERERERASERKKERKKEGRSRKLDARPSMPRGPSGLLRCLADSSLPKSQISDVVLVGGSTRLGLGSCSALGTLS